MAGGGRDVIVSVPLVDVLVDESDPLRALVLPGSRVHIVSAVAATILQEAVAPGIDREDLTRVLRQRFGAPVPQRADRRARKPADVALRSALEVMLSDLRVAGLLRTPE